MPKKHHGTISMFFWVIFWNSHETFWYYHLEPTAASERAGTDVFQIFIGQQNIMKKKLYKLGFSSNQER